MKLNEQIGRMKSIMGLISEGEEEEQKMRELIDQGMDPVEAYMRCQITDDFTLIDLFNEYGELAANDLYQRDSHKFLDDIHKYKLQNRFKDIENIMINYFHNGDYKSAEKDYKEYNRKYFEDDDTENLQKINSLMGKNDK